LGLRDVKENLQQAAGPG
jgi:hypothetical protein